MLINLLIMADIGWIWFFPSKLGTVPGVSMGALGVGGEGMGGKLSFFPHHFPIYLPEVFPRPLQNHFLLVLQ